MYLAEGLAFNQVSSYSKIFIDVCTHFSLRLAPMQIDVLKRFHWYTTVSFRTVILAIVNIILPIILMDESI